MISDVEEIRPRVAEACNIRSYFRLHLAGRPESVAHPAKSVIR